MKCCFVEEIWNTILEHYLIPINSDLSFVNWIKVMWKYEKVYNKLYYRSMEKIFVIAYSILIHRNRSFIDTQEYGYF